MVPRHPLALFMWVRLRVAKRAAALFFQSPAKVGVVFGVWGVLLVGIYFLSHSGIHFVYETAGLGPFLLSRIWFLFLFVVMILMMISQLAGAFSTMIKAPESRWWMSLPVSARSLCRMKWLESSLYSAWAVVVLLLPTSLAYLVVLKKPLWLAVWFVGLLVVPFLLIVTAVSTGFLFIWLRWFRRLWLRREVVLTTLLLAGIGLFWLLGERQKTTQGDVWFIALQELLPRMRVAMSMALPSSWVATAMDATINAQWIEATLYTLLLWTSLLAAFRLLDHLGAFWLFPILRDSSRSFDLSADQSASARPLLSAWWMRRPLLSAMAKDVLLIVRDPVQWSQGLLFFGLLGAYFGNLHRFGYASAEPSWRIGIAALNCACTLLVFGSLAVRFVFPQMSLEGRVLWLLRVSPKGMLILMASKMWLYGILAVSLIEGLLLLSTQRLLVPQVIQGWLLVMGFLAALTIVSLAVGLGALWIDPSAQDASRVVSSANGALVLVFMLLYVGAVVLAFIVAWGSWTVHFPQGLILSSVGLLIVSLFAGFLPVVKGFKRLEALQQL